MGGQRRTKRLVAIEGAMDNRILSFRPDVVGIQTAPRPTPAPVRVRFSDVLAGGAQALVRGAQAAVRALPGAPLMAVAVRGTTGVPTTTLGVSVTGAAAGSIGSVGAAPEGPGGTAASAGPLANGAGGAASDPAAGGLEDSIAQSQELNLYYLQVQEE